MQRLAERRHVEEGDRSLQRVDGAEGAIQPITRLSVALQSQQVVDCLLRQLRRLKQKLLKQFVHHESGRW